MASNDKSIEYLLGLKRERDKDKRKITELEKIDQEEGISDPLQIGNCAIVGSNGTRIAIAIRAFASAPPKIRRSWKRTYINAIIIGMNIK